MNSKADMNVSVQRLNDLRGLMAIWIVLGHLALSMDAQRNIFLMMQKADLAIVGMFFFLSGYGLEKSLETKKDYLRGFLFKKMARLLLMTWVQFGVTELCLYLVKFPRDYSGLTGILGEYASNLNWYMWELALMYLIFFVSHILFKDKKAYIAATVLSVLLLITLYYFQGAFASTYSCLAFPAGMIVYACRHKFEKASGSRFGEMFIALLILTGLTTASTIMPKDLFASVAGKNLFCVCFVILAAVTFLRLEADDKPYRILAKFSPEIYLYQFPAASVTMAIACRHHDRPRGLLYAAVTFVLTMVMAVIMYLVRRGFEKVINNDN